MMRGLLIAAIDVLTLLLIVTLLGFFAIQYGKKGSGEKNWIQAGVNMPNDAAFINEAAQISLTAIVLKGNTIGMIPVIDGKVNKEGKKILVSTSELVNNIENDKHYVIYEQDGKDMLAEVIRIMVRSNVESISFAEVCK